MTNSYDIVNKLSQRATDNDKELQKKLKMLLTKRNGCDILNKLFRATDFDSK